MDRGALHPVIRDTHSLRVFASVDFCVSLCVRKFFFTLFILYAVPGFVYAAPEKASGKTVLQVSAYWRMPAESPARPVSRNVPSELQSHHYNTQAAQQRDTRAAGSNDHYLTEPGRVSFRGLLSICLPIVHPQKNSCLHLLFPNHYFW
jgi:hypothetical protein